MPEPTLGLTLDELRSELAGVVGYNRTYASLSTEQTAQIDASIRSGLRNFYFAYQWSFLRPQAQIVTESGKSDYDLPDDFAFVYGKLTYSTEDRRIEVPQVPEQQIRALRQGIVNNGTPQYFATRLKTYGELAGTSGPRYEMIFWPTPDDVYTLTYRYSLLPNALTADRPYPFGGEAHAETILQSCLAVFEQRYDAPESQSHQAKYQALLAQSIAFDARQDSPGNLGRLGPKWNTSQRVSRPWRDWSIPSVTYSP